MSLRQDRARVAISLAQRCISDLIESYKAKCAETEDYDQVHKECIRAAKHLENNCCSEFALP